MREKTRVAVKQPVRPAGGGADIAMAVEHDEGVVVLERAARSRRRTRRWNIERRLGNRVLQRLRERGALDRHAVPVSSFPSRAPAAAWDSCRQSGSSAHPEPRPWPPGAPAA